MLGDVQEDAILESEFADEYQDWLQGRPSVNRAAWFDFPVRKLARARPLGVERSQTVQSVVTRMKEQKSGSALVLESGKLVGIFTERDLLRRVIAEGLDPRETSVGDVMSEQPEAIPVSATMAQALRFLAQWHYRHAPLVDESNQPVGMLSTGHVIAFVSEAFPKEILNAPPEAARAPKKEEGA